MCINYNKDSGKSKREKSFEYHYQENFHRAGRIWMIFRMRSIPLILKLRLSGKIVSRYIWSHRACLQESETAYKTVKQSTDILDSKAVSHEHAMLYHVKENIENEIYFIVKNLSGKKKVHHTRMHTGEKNKCLNLKVK